MDLEHWEQIKEHIRRKFKVIEEGTEDLVVPVSSGEVKSGKAEFLIAETPMGKVKLVLEKRPVVLDKKFIYSHRAGQSARTEYQFSDTEFSYKLKAYKWSDDEDPSAPLGAGWKEIDASNFGQS